MKSELMIPLILGIVIAVVVIGFSLFLSSLDSQVLESKDGDTKTNIIPNENKIDKSGFKKAPKLVGISEYINILPDKLQEKIDKSVVLYDIWTYSCINCIRTLPFITSWNEKYADEGLLIIGIHSPEFEFEKDVTNVKNAVAKYGIKYPVVLDNEKETWKAFENNYWPRKYIADHEGYIRYDHIGEGGYKETEKVIQTLLKERSDSMGMEMKSEDSLVQISEFEHTSFRTPELYFGYKFASGRNQLGSLEGFKPNNDVTYKLPEMNLQKDHFYLDGTWKNLEGSMRLVSENGSILLPYSGKQVNIVTESKASLQIYIDGKIIDQSIAGDNVGIDGLVHASDAGLYNIVSSKNSEDHVLQIFVDSVGFEIYTFTFG